MEKIPRINEPNRHIWRVRRYFSMKGNLDKPLDLEHRLAYTSPKVLRFEARQPFVLPIGRISGPFHGKLLQQSYIHSQSAIRQHFRPIHNAWYVVQPKWKTPAIDCCQQTRHVKD